MFRHWIKVIPFKNTFDHFTHITGCNQINNLKRNYFENFILAAIQFRLVNIKLLNKQSECRLNDFPLTVFYMLQNYDNCHINTLLEAGKLFHRTEKNHRK